MTATSPPATATHPRTHSVEFWRARLGAMASRGETDGPRVDEARAALSWWRRHAFLIKELDLTPERAASLTDLITDHAATEREAVAR